MRPSLFCREIPILSGEKSFDYRVAFRLGTPNFEGHLPPRDCPITKSLVHVEEKLTSNWRQFASSRVAGCDIDQVAISTSNIQKFHSGSTPEASYLYDVQCIYICVFCILF